MDKRVSVMSIKSQCVKAMMMAIHAPVIRIDKTMEVTLKAISPSPILRFMTISTMAIAHPRGGMKMAKGKEENESSPYRSVNECFCPGVMPLIITALFSYISYQNRLACINKTRCLPHKRH